MEHQDNMKGIKINEMGKEIWVKEDFKNKQHWDDILGSGALLKKIVKQGTENSRPQRLDICTINYICSLEDGLEVDSGNEFQMQLGDLEMVQGLDLTIALMNIGEICHLRIEPRFAFGSYGLDERVLADTTVYYQIQLLKAERDEDIENLSISQRKEKGDLKKQRGNWWYGRGDYTFAVQLYRRALDYLDEVEGGISEPSLLENDDPQQREKMDAALQQLMEDRINVCNNMAAAQMKLGVHDAALQSLQLVLHCQPNNVKALYRKAKILKVKNETEEALKCLQKAKTLEPENATIQKEIQEITSLLKRHQNYEKELARRMLNDSTGFRSKRDTTTNSDARNTSVKWALIVTSVAVAIVGAVTWRFKYS